MDTNNWKLQSEKTSDKKKRKGHKKARWRRRYEAVEVDEDSWLGKEEAEWTRKQYE